MASASVATSNLGRRRRLLRAAKAPVPRAPANNPALPACAIARHRRRLQSLRPAGEPVHRCLQPDQRVIPKSGNRFFGRDHAQSKDLGEMTNQREVIPLEA
jgi:hypothetical protein